MRCILDPQATNDALQHLFENPQIADLTEGGLLTGAGGGGFALLIAAEGQAAALRARLDKLSQHAAFAEQQSGLLSTQCPRHPSRVRTAAVATKKEHLLIDGYNLIKASQLFQGRGDSLERARNRLQQALAAYGRRVDKHITLYYDGTGAAPNTASTSGPHVTIEFSRYPQQADDLIAQAVEKKHGAKWLRVISSDRAVQRCAARHKIRSTCSEDFIDELTGPVQAPSAPAPAPERDGTEADPSLDLGRTRALGSLVPQEKPTRHRPRLTTTARKHARRSTRTN